MNEAEPETKLTMIGLKHYCSYQSKNIQDYKQAIDAITESLKDHYYAYGKSFRNDKEESLEAVHTKTRKMLNLLLEYEKKGNAFPLVRPLLASLAARTSVANMFIHNTYYFLDAAISECNSVEEFSRVVAFFKQFYAFFCLIFKRNQ